MNTPPVLYLDEQQVKIKNTLTGSQPVDTCAEVQDNMLQPESPGDKVRKLPFSGI